MPKAVTAESMFDMVETAFKSCEPEVSLASRAPLFWVLRYIFGLEEIEA